MVAFAQHFAAGEFEECFGFSSGQWVGEDEGHLPGDPAVVVVAERSRLVSVSSVWAGSVAASDALWDQHLEASLRYRRCLIPLTSFTCAAGRSLVNAVPKRKLLFVAAGILAWDSVHRREVCLALGLRTLPDISALVPLAVPPSEFLSWAGGRAKSQMFSLMEDYNRNDLVTVSCVGVHRSWHERRDEDLPVFGDYPSSRELGFGNYA